MQKRTAMPRKLRDSWLCQNVDNIYHNYKIGTSTMPHCSVKCHIQLPKGYLSRTRTELARTKSNAASVKKCSARTGVGKGSADVHSAAECMLHQRPSQPASGMENLVPPHAIYGR